jgi:hypothetical protein
VHGIPGRPPHWHASLAARDRDQAMGSPPSQIHGVSGPPLGSGLPRGLCRKGLGTREVGGDGTSTKPGGPPGGRLREIPRRQETGPALLLMVQHGGPSPALRNRVRGQGRQGPCEGGAAAPLAGHRGRPQRRVRPLSRGGAFRPQRRRAG